MSVKDWKRIREIFDSAVELLGEARNRYVAEACGDDVDLRIEIEKLLIASDHAGSFIERPVLNIAGIASDDEPEYGYVGRQIGSYLVLQEIGRGGMGAVFLAERADGEYRKKVAIKILQPDVGKREIERFRRERQILADLDHHNIARLIDAGTIDGLPWIAMDYVEGKNLRTIIEERGAIPLGRVVEITRQICSGLAAAHGIGVIHRDIKPENIIVSDRENSVAVKILDFGIARSIEDGTKNNITSTGIIMGTASYMSPEQSIGVVGQKIDTRADIYSLGTVIYEMITGLKVFESNSMLEILLKHRHEKPLPLRKRRPDLNIPEAIDRVVLKALEKDRFERHQAVTDLAAELEAAFQESQKKSDNGDLKAFAIAILGVLAIAAFITVISLTWLKKQPPIPAASGTGPLAVSPALGTSALPAARPGEVEVMKYYLEVVDDSGRTRKATDADLLKPAEGFKFHFTATEPGFIYIVARKNNKPTLFLSGRKTGQRGELLNRVEAGKDFVFPGDPEEWIGVKSQIQTFTIIFSPNPLDAPAFLRAESQHELTGDETDEFEKLRWKSAVDIGELKVEKGTVTVLADRASMRPLVFHIPIRLKY